MKKEKIFHDTVHGDICVPSIYCDQIIDTILFQRLRRIEQTSMRSLFPCARHDRFIHSLGVFHLGKILINNIKLNTESNNELWHDIEPIWNEITESFQIACLLHDIGHSPFSHTFENYFDNNTQKKKLSTILQETIQNDSFSDDLPQEKDPKPHEKMSAYLAYKIYYQAIIQLQGNPLYVVRMILGIRFHTPKSEQEKIVNCIIPLLHGTIDVDRIDYAIRDQWASGFSSVKLNVNRILTSGIIVKSETNKPVFCFLKKAIDQLQNLIDVKNYQKSWIFSHHKIQYDQMLLTKAIECMAKNIDRTQEEPDDILNKIFSINIFEDTEYHIGNHCIYLLSDDDLIHLMKQTITKNPYAQEWFSRKCNKKPLWKSPTEYTQLFLNYNKLSKDKIKRKLTKYTPFEIIEVELALDIILDNDISLFINNQIIDYRKLKLREDSKNTIDKMFYVFVDEQFIQYKDRIIEELKNIE